MSCRAQKLLMADSPPRRAGISSLNVRCFWRLNSLETLVMVIAAAALLMYFILSSCHLVLIVNFSHTDLMRPQVGDTVLLLLVGMVFSLVLFGASASLVAAQTPTPAIQIHLYQDPLDDTIQVVGGMCQRQGYLPTDQPVANTTARAFSASLDETFPAYSVSDQLKVVTGHDSGTSDYRVTVLLPTPAPGHIGPLYTCSCPYSSGQDYVCEYVGITANEAVNVFVTDINANEAWWQVYGGQIYAKYRIRSKIPVEACTMSGTCIASLLVAQNGSDSVGFVTVGAAGLVETDRNGSDDYIHQPSDRTTAANAYATGLKQQQIDYAYYYQALQSHMAEFANMGQLESFIASQADDTAAMYYYTGASPLIIDQSSAAIPLDITDGKQVTIFVPANLEFRHTYGSVAPQLTSVDNDSFLGFFVAGNVTIAAEVGYTDITTDPDTALANISAVVVADGQLTVASDNDSSVTDRKLIAEGSFVAWDKSEIGNGVVLRRNFDNSTDGKTLNSQYPSEVFRFRSAFMANYPSDLKITAQAWQEIAPQR